MFRIALMVIETKLLNTIDMSPVKEPAPIPLHTAEKVAKILWRYRRELMYVINLFLYLLKLKKKKPMKPHVKEFIEKIVFMFDEKTNTGIFEPFDSMMLTRALSAGWGLMEQNMSPQWIDIIEQFILSLQSDSDSELIEKLVPIIDGRIDLPNIPEEKEAEIIKSLLQVISLSVRGLISKP